MSESKSCCGCGAVSTAVSYVKDSNEVCRGLVFIGRGNWLCPSCTKTAVAAFARLAASGRAEDIAREEPPPGYV